MQVLMDSLFGIESLIHSSALRALLSDSIGANMRQPEIAVANPKTERVIVSLSETVPLHKESPLPAIHSNLVGLQSDTSNCSAMRCTTSAHSISST